MSPLKTVFRHTPPEESEAHLWVPRRGMWARRKAIGRWPLEDEFRWIENRLLEQETSHRSGVPDGLRKEIKEKLSQDKPPPPEVRDLQIWLVRERDGGSWNKIANRYYPVRSKPSARQNSAHVSAVRRAHERVEGYLIRLENGGIR